MRAALGLLVLAGTAHAQPGAPSRKPRLPSVKISVPVVTGALDKQVVRRIVHRQRAKFQYCYEKHLLMDPKLAGTLQLAFEIAGDGTVQNAGTMGLEGEVARCSKSALDATAFPRPTDGKGVGVKFALTLSP